MIKLVYFGKKRPKVIQTIPPESLELAKAEDKRKSGGVTFIPSPGKVLKYNFNPFQAVEVEDAVATVLLEKANDIFKRVDQNENSPDPKPKVSTDGYVGDTHAENIKNLGKRKRLELKAEEGKSIEEIIDEGKSKKKRVNQED